MPKSLRAITPSEPIGIIRPTMNWRAPNRFGEPGNPWEGTVSGPVGDQPTATENDLIVNHSNDVVVCNLYTDMVGNCTQRTERRSDS